MLIVRVARDTAVVARIRAELEANDWNVREIGPDPASARGSLSQLAASSRARAVLRMQPERGAIELWVRGEGDAAGSGEVLVVPRHERDDALLALRATEALRARGLRLQRRSEPEGASPGDGTGQPDGTAPASGSPTSAAPPAGEPRSSAASPPTAPPQARSEPRAPQPSAAVQAPPTQKPKPDREPRPERPSQDAEPTPDDLAAASGSDDEQEEEPEEAEAEAETETETEIADEPDEPGRRDRPMLLSVELAPGLSASPGEGVSVAWIGWLNVRLQPHERWSLNAMAFAPFAGGTLASEGQRAEIRSYLVGGSLDVHWPGRLVDLTAGAGAAFMLTRMKGLDVVGTNAKRDELVPTGALLARAGVHVPLTRRVEVVGRVLLGMSIPKLTVKFAGRTAGHAGQPFVTATVGVSVSLF